jgi:lysozyme
MSETTDTYDAAMALIGKHEGYTQFPKPDAKNTIEIGYGTNLNTRGISRGEAAYLAGNDVNRLMNWFGNFPFFQRLTTPRKAALLDMAYDLGEAGVDEFAGMLRWLDADNYEKAADEMLNSAWAKQVPNRALADALMMREG